jgi:hypothetical protein
MPEKETLERAAKDRRQGKSASTQAGEFVREEIHHIREGKHGARSTKQAIAIGLSKARRAGVKLGAPEKGRTSADARRRAKRDLEAGAHGDHAVSRARSRAMHRALEREGHQAASPRAMSRQGSAAAKKRTAADRSRAARKAVATKGTGGRKRAALKAARTRAK